MTINQHGLNNESQIAMLYRTRAMWIDIADKERSDRQKAEKRAKKYWAELVVAREKLRLAGLMGKK
jgi:hypothetical protein